MGVREHPERECDEADLVYGFDELERALEQADFVVLALPVTPKTHHLINAERLAQLKPDAYLINVARGILIDEEALVTALRAKSFAGAALDVTSEEPLPPGISAVGDGERLHHAAHRRADRHDVGASLQHYTENLRRFLVGKPLLWVVDKEKGY